MTEQSPDGAADADRPEPAEHAVQHALVAVAGGRCVR
jgi:hypothetical protein